MVFKEEAEYLGLGQESGERSTSTEEGNTEGGYLSGECEMWDEDSDESSDYQDSLCMILAEEKIRHRDRELQTDPSSGTFNLDVQEVRGGEELERIAVSRKPFKELSCNSNGRTNLVPEDDMKIVRRIVCVKLNDDIHNPGEMNGQIMALKEHVKARYRLSDLIRDVKNGSDEGQSIQQVDISAGKHMKTENPLFGWTATDSPLDIPPDNSDPVSSTGTSINIFVRGGG